MIYKALDPVADYNEYVEDCEAYASKFPKCSCCKDPINVDRLHYKWNDQFFCEICFNWKDVPEDEEDEVEIL